MLRPTIALTITTLLGAGGVAAENETTPGQLATDETSTDPEDIHALGEVFFEFDSARVPDNASALDGVVGYAKQHPRATIVLDGHTDPVGASDYNVRLSVRRAENTRAELIQAGLPADRVILGIYGEDGLERATHALDRRVTAWATEAPLHVIIDRSLPTAVAVVWDEPVSAAEIDGPRVPEVATR